MNILAFRRNPDPHSWQAAEMQTLTSACEAYVSKGQASGWEIGKTEAGDPQLYLMGPAPDHDCMLSVSRLGRLYVLEDGQGRVLFEHGSVMLLAEQIRTALRRQKGAIVARVALAWCVVRETIEERIEPLLAEPVEMLAHVAPQLAAFA